MVQSPHSKSTLAVVAININNTFHSENSELYPHLIWMINSISIKLDQNVCYFRVDLYMNRILIQNGVAFNATWVTIATLLNLGIVIAYWGGVDQSTASTVSLSVLTCEVLVYFVLENFILERYLRYTYSVWPVVIWALSGSIAQNWDSSNTNSIITAVLLALACALYLVKIGLSIWRGRTQPLTGHK